MATLGSLTSTTGPGKMFASRGELAEHYKSDWHKYNLKRREANMPMLTHEEFSARLEAAMALRREREGRKARSGMDHLKDKSGSKNKKDKKKNNGEDRVSKRQLRQQERQGKMKVPAEEKETEENMMEEEETDIVQEEPPEIDPNQSLFDKFISSDVKSNIEYMYTTYGFFVPDRECLVDEEGFIGYCAEKIKIGQTCLYCQKMFRTWKGCQKHMINSRHAKLRYETGIDLDEFDVFYDFSADNADFLTSGIGNHKKRDKKEASKETGDEDEAMEVVDEAGDDDEWEDFDSDEEMEGDDGLYAAYQDEIARHGFDITPLGELIFPDGRIIGHRGLSRYYRQRLSANDDRASVAAARKANGERLYKGRVYDTYGMNEEEQDGPHGKSTALQLAKAGLSVGAAPGRSGKGILVPHSGVTGGAASYTALSLYRYKAAMKKMRKEEYAGRKLQQRTTLPMNKMDKKANRLHNNVSVAHAPR